MIRQKSEKLITSSGMKSFFSNSSVLGIEVLVTNVLIPLLISFS